MKMPYKDYKNKMRGYMNSRYHNRRAWLKKILGPGCARCGEDVEEFHIDHINPSNKRHKINRVLDGLAKEKLAKEMINLQILCPPCHLEKSKEDGSLARVHIPR
jgi:5-methylcytosine-specific restriction endonuclease McrA